MPQLTFYPTGNADCCVVDLAGGEKLLFDYADVGDPDDLSDRRINLEKAIRQNLADAQRNHFEVVSFSHLDRDHICRSSDLLYLEHAQKYQGPDRVRMTEMWVPAAMIIEEGPVDEARVLRAEARYRFKQGRGIRVFSRPDLLKDWLTGNGLTLESRRHLIVDAGTIVPTFNLAKHGVEFFAHSPFGHRLNETEVIDRNTDSIMVQATFAVDGVLTRVLFLADATYEAIDDIVGITKYHKRPERLLSDVVKLPHHTSYLSIGPEKGADQTRPTAGVEWLYEQCQPGAKLVSTSFPIPENDREVQPPHRQAANYYRAVARKVNGEYLVTMEHPNPRQPKPLVILIDSTKARVKLGSSVGTATVISSKPPRAG